MANDVSSRQWRLDTPNAFGNPGALLWPGEVYIKQMVFQDYPAQASTATLKNRNGKIFWQPTGEADLAPVRIADIGWVEGLVLDALTGGNVTVYIK